MSPKKARSPGASLLAVPLALGLSAGVAQAASYTVHPEIEIEQSFDDNVLSDESELDTWGTRYAPSVSLARRSETSEATLRLGLTRRNSYSVSEIDGTDKLVSGGGRRNFTPRLSAGLYGNYEFYAAYGAIEGTGVNGTPQVLFSDRPELTWQGLTGDLTYELDDVTDLKAEAEWNDYEYDDSERTDLYNNNDYALTLTLTRRLSAMDKIGLAAGLSYSEEENSQNDFHESGSDLVAQELENRSDLATATAFWQRVWSTTWSTTLRAGVRDLKSESDNRTEIIRPDDLAPGCGPPIGESCQYIIESDESDSGSGFIGSGSVTHAYSDRGTATLSLSRDTRTGTTSATGSSAVDTDSLSVGLTHALSRRVSLTLSGSYVSYETTGEVRYTNALGISVPADSGANTRMHTAGVRLDWQLRKNLAAYTRFDYFDIDQERPLSSSNLDREYTRRFYGVGVRYFFDHEL